MMTVKELIKRLIKLENWDKEVMIDGPEYELSSIDPCGNEDHCPGYILWSTRKEEAELVEGPRANRKELEKRLIRNWVGYWESQVQAYDEECAQDVRHDKDVQKDCLIEFMGSLEKVLKDEGLIL